MQQNHLTHDLVCVEGINPFFIHKYADKNMFWEQKAVRFPLTSQHRFYEAPHQSPVVCWRPYLNPVSRLMNVCTVHIRQPCPGALSEAGYGGWPGPVSVVRTCSASPGVPASVTTSPNIGVACGRMFLRYFCVVLKLRGTLFNSFQLFIYDKLIRVMNGSP